ncbi:MAG: pyridoxamine 5'-phosphate oxidase family protein [Nitrososphaerota archaeon]
MSIFANEVLAFINSQKIMRLSTCNKCFPHVVPLCFVIDNGHIYFETKENTRKVRNILRNRKVAALFDEYGDKGGKPYYKGVIAQGEASILEYGSDEFLRAKELLYKKYPFFEKHFPIIPGSGRIIIKIIVNRLISWEYP